MKLTILRAMQEINSRDRFVDEVVNSIATSDGQDEAFIFGISGKWGEGKTFFLKKLRTELEKCTSVQMKVVELNPWKYAHTDDSILRELLRQILKLQSNPIKRWLLSRKLQGLYHDVSKKRINWMMTAIAALILAGLSLLYKYPPDLLTGMKDFIVKNKTLVTLLFIPVLLGIANAVTTSESSTKAVSTRDKFSDLFDELMKDLAIEKVVVYVDDLDRLTASKAVSVLDSLRTFFDKKKLVFIVASDNTVLERHLGHELMPDADPPDQMEEGRRFLKKIFNVYWRLPLPTKPEFENYVKTLVGKDTNQFLHDKLLNPTNRKAFKGYLQDYFSNNFRNTERFVNRVVFTFRLIEAQHTSRTGPKINKEYFGEMLENPLLVVRILLIEENANPLFEKIQHKPELLLTLEQQTTEGATSEVTFEDALGGLSDEQKSFIRTFLGEKPRFRDETGVKVKSIEPYIFLSSDSSFGDIRGLSPKEFTAYLQKDATSDLATILSRSSEQKINEAMDAFSAEYAPLTDLPQKSKLLSNLVQVAKASDPKLPAQSIIIGHIFNYDLTFLDQLTAAEKIKLTEEIGSLSLSEDQFNLALQKVPNFTQNEWAAITVLDDKQPITQLTQHKFLQYFVQYFASNPGDAITQLGPRLESFSASSVNGVIKDQLPQLISYFINDNNDARREYWLAMFRKTDDGVEMLKDNLKGQLSASNASIFNWLAGPAKTSSEPLFSMHDLVDAVIFDPTAVSSIADLTQRLTLFQSIPEAKDILWEALQKLDHPMLIDTLYEAVLINNYLPIAPTSDAANSILEIIIRRFITQDTASSPETIGWLGRITPGHWVFANLKLNGQLTRLIDARLSTQYLTDEVRQHLERIKNDFGGGQ